MFQGLYVALVTPFREDGCLNEDLLRELVSFHVEVGTDGLVPCGTTGENPSLHGWEEQRRVIEIVAREARGRLKVIAGAGTHSTSDTVENLKSLAGLGVDGALVITPYYNKPSQAGLVAHFRACAAESPVPLVLYNVPSRTGVNLSPETMAQIASEEKIVALKEATGDLEQASWLYKLCGDRIGLLSGEDSLIFPMMCLGATGAVSVLGNIVPQDILTMIAAIKKGDYDTARAWHLRLLPLARALFLETNPVPVKEALNMIGFKVGLPRLPLVEMKPDTRELLEKALADYSLVRPGAEKK